VNGPLFGKSLCQRLRECHHTFYHFKGNQPILVMMKFVLNKPLFFILSTEELYLEIKIISNNNKHPWNLKTWSD